MQRGLAGAAAADDRDELAREDREVDVVQQRVAALHLRAEPDRVEPDARAARRGGGCARRSKTKRWSPTQTSSPSLERRRCEPRAVDERAVLAVEVAQPVAAADCSMTAWWRETSGDWKTMSFSGLRPMRIWRPALGELRDALLRDLEGAAALGHVVSAGKAFDDLGRTPDGAPAPPGGRVSSASTAPRR